MIFSLKKHLLIRNFSIIVCLFIFASYSEAQTIEDNFEGDGTITTWFGDDCNINITSSNPYQQGINNSSTVLEYGDVGGQYANVRFQVANNFDLSTDYIFSLKIYVPTSGLTGNSPNQISLKLQDGNLGAPWETQSEIIKPIVLDQWQTIEFDFLNDNYINLDSNSPPPTQRSDFNRVVIQVNGENNNDQVLAYLDDILYDGTIETDLVYDVLVWSDEFDDNGPINTSKWHHQTQLPNGESWFNGEIQHYTDRIDNTYVNDGILNILGKKETYTDQGQTKQYTSARLNSKFTFIYGKVEVRAKLPAGVGTWPAIWMLGKNINEDGGYWDLEGYGTTSWPACGEIDIMEHWGVNQNYVQSATHTPSSFGATINHGGQVISNASTEFHIYTLEWFPNKLVFSVDGNQHYTYKPEVYNADTWPFNQEQYILLNFAFLPEISPIFSQDALEVDYVRVYGDAPIPTSATSIIDQKINLKNTPNPASDETLISYNLTTNSQVNISIYDINGRLIRTIVDEKQTTGNHQVNWKLNDLSAGIYFYTLKTDDQVVSRKCIVE